MSSKIKKVWVGFAILCLSLLSSEKSEGMEKEFSLKPELVNSNCNDYLQNIIKENQFKVDNSGMCTINKIRDINEYIVSTISSTVCQLLELRASTLSENFHAQTQDYLDKLKKLTESEGEGKQNDEFPSLLVRDAVNKIKDTLVKNLEDKSLIFQCLEFSLCDMKKAFKTFKEYCDNIMYQGEGALKPDLSPEFCQIVNQELEEMNNARKRFKSFFQVYLYGYAHERAAWIEDLEQGYNIMEALGHVTH